MLNIDELKPQWVREVRREAIGLHGWVVIDQRQFGFASGGVRMRSEVTLDEVAWLAREMTLKYAFLRIKKDGSKAAIVAPIDAPAERKAELCRAFGEELRFEIQGGLYTPGEDMGTGPAEYAQIMAGAGLTVTPPQLCGEYFTALTAALCATEWLREQKRDPEHATVLLEGYGKVGGEAAKLLRRAGVHVAGVSTIHGALYDPAGLDMDRLATLRAEHGDACVLHYEGAEHLPRELLLERPADIFFPGAGPDSLAAERVPRIGARCLISIANISADAAAESALAARGLDFIPGYVANCGGILGFYLGEQGFGPAEVEQLIRTGFAVKVRRLLRNARASNLPLHEAARETSDRHLVSLGREQTMPLIKWLDPRRYAWLAWRQLGGGGLRPLMLPYAQRYMNERLFTGQ